MNSMSESERKRRNPSPRKVTPPGSLIELPPPPPHSGKKEREHFGDSALLFRFLRALNAVPVVGKSRTFRLQPHVYSRTLEYLKESDRDVWGYVLDKVKFDLVDDRLLILKMPSTIHEVTAEKIRAAIEHGLEAMSRHSNKATNSLINDIECTASAFVRFGEERHRCPDKQFRIEKLFFPGVVIEVAYSQSERKMGEAAKDYILDSLGEVQMVIGIELDRKPLCIRLTTWCPTFESEGDVTWVDYKKPIDNILIRDKQGNVLPGSLQVRLRDFGPQADLDRLYPGAELDQSFAIPYKDIVEYVLKADRFQEVVKSVRAPPLKMRRRPRSESPVEEIDSPDERGYERREKQVERAMSEGDDDYAD